MRLFLELPDSRVHFLDQGSGPPLVLLHGWPEFCGIWRHNLPALAGRFRVLAPDFRGFGQSRPRPGSPPLPSNPATLAADLWAMLDHLSPERVGLISHDVGAQVAQVLARRHPQRIAGLFFFDCPYPGIGRRWAESAMLSETWHQYFNQLPWAAKLVGSSREACRRFLSPFLCHWAGSPEIFSEAATEEWVDNFPRPGAWEGGFAWYAGIDQARRGLIKEGAPRWPQIETPARFLWGARDPIIPAAWADRLEEYLADYRWELAPQAGYFVPREVPEPAKEARLSFFTSLPFLRIRLEGPRTGQP
ncbi:MAG: alpha/beta hydrolase [Deltaproteobacteria bacterium]|nr:alpha/beta hydrolase [Deltaproteobacteria bacterium]